MPHESGSCPLRPRSAGINKEVYGALPVRGKASRRCRQAVGLIESPPVHTRLIHARHPQRAHEWRRNPRRWRPGPGLCLSYAGHVHGLAGAGHLRHGPGRCHACADRPGHWCLWPDAGRIADPVRDDLRSHRPPAGDLPGAGHLCLGQCIGRPGRLHLGSDRRAYPAGRRGDFRCGHGAAVRPHSRAAPDQGHGHDRHEHRPVVCCRHGRWPIADSCLWLVRIVPRHGRTCPGRHPADRLCGAQYPQHPAAP
ncbi:hypothetical protein D3C80_696030 [compost metagenome]